jgi:hypothetical protein
MPWISSTAEQQSSTALFQAQQRPIILQQEEIFWCLVGSVEEAMGGGSDKSYAKDVDEVSPRVRLERLC